MKQCIHRGDSSSTERQRTVTGQTVVGIEQSTLDMHRLSCLRYRASNQYVYSEVPQSQSQSQLQNEKPHPVKGYSCMDMWNCYKQELPCYKWTVFSCLLTHSCSEHNPIKVISGSVVVQMKVVVCRWSHALFCSKGRFVCNSLPCSASPIHSCKDINLNLQERGNELQFDI